MRISVDMCLAGRELTEPKLAPDGRSVAYVVRWGSTCAIAVVPASGGPERLLTTAPEPSPGRGLGGGCFAWVHDGSAVVYAARDGDLWRQPFPGGPPERITAVGDGHRAEAPVVDPSGGRVAACIDQAEVWEWPLRPGAAGRRLDDGRADFVFDPSPMPAGVDAGWIWQAWNVPDMPWDASRADFVIDDSGGDLRRGTYRPGASIQQLRHHPDGRGTSVRDDTGWLNVWLGDEPLVDEPIEHAGPGWGMGQRSYAVAPDGGRVAFTRNESGFGRLCVIDVQTREVSEVARGVHGQLTWSGDRLAAIRTGARTPTQVVLYETGSWSRRVLAVGPVAGWDEADLVEPELVEIEHDGVTLHARRYVAGNGRTICWVHGGPTDQWAVEFMPRVAYWRAQGWDVLVPDPRGTTGHGRAYQQALRGEWGRLDVDDTAAIVQSSHSSGWSHPARTVMMGSSSGGLTVLGVLSRHGHLVAGGVSLYPVADLAALPDASHRFESHSTIHLVGPLDDVETYRDRSPVHQAAAIDRPLLVMHGDADPVVPIASTTLLVERLRAAGRDVEFIVMAGEGHGFRDPHNKRREYELTREFLARVVDGE